MYLHIPMVLKKGSKVTVLIDGEPICEEIVKEDINYFCGTMLYDCETMVRRGHFLRAEIK